MDKATKIKWKEELTEYFNKANAIMVAEYRGLTVEDVTTLRRELRKSNAQFKIIKNRIAKKAIADSTAKTSPISGDLKGPIGLVYVYGDLAQTAKTVLDFCQNKDLFKFRTGVIENDKISEQDLKAIASLPSKQVLLSQIVGSLVAPHRNLLGVLNAVNRELVQVISAIKDKKQA